VRTALNPLSLPENGRADERRTDRRDVCVALIPPPPPANPYLSLLYSHLERHGVKAVEDGEFHVRWLWRNRRQIDALHVNWPEGLYTHRRGSRRLQALLSWLKLPVFGVRLRLARAFGYRVAWTIHQVYPHESMSRVLDRTAGVLLARSCDVLFVHDEPTAANARRELNIHTRPIEVIAHGSYLGVYAAGRPRSVVRAELGIPQDSFAFLSFGELRGYKDVELLLDAFRRVEDPAVALIVAGHPKDPALAARVAAAAGRDSRIKPLLQHVRQDRVAELFGAVDAAVLGRGDGGTSGSLVLALSMGVPAVVADRPAYRALLHDGIAGWFFEPGDRASISATLERAAADRADARLRGAAARRIAEGLSWPDIAARAATFLVAPGR
jgi:glycosyltransferase involved in cell wall biosynthesis